jgi:hypothetical protein
MSAKRTRKQGRIVRYENPDDIPIKPLNRKLIEMSDEEAGRRAAADPDAALIPPGFWDKAPAIIEACARVTERSDAHRPSAVRAPLRPRYRAPIVAKIRTAPAHSC